MADVTVSPATTQAHGDAWQQYVDQHPEAVNYHRWGWKRVIETSFAWPTFYLMLEQAGAVRGVLPLVWQKSFLFGSFFTALPFFNYGGILADDARFEQRLSGEAIALAKRVGATHIEFRHQRPHELGLAVKQSKLTLVRDVQREEDAMWKSLDKKVRADVKKSMQYGLTAEVCGAEALPEFYEIFARNMRDLGTPVYDRSFFANILAEFPHDTFLTVVRHEGKAIASSFLLGHRGTLEVPWSASLREHLTMKPNMLLYWKNLRVAAEKGYSRFDFGRSSPDSGTHRFKKQWEPAEIPLYWHYWMAGGGEMPELNPHNRKYRLAIAAWQRLPLQLTKSIGPRIVRCLP